MKLREMIENKGMSYVAMLASLTMACGFLSGSSAYAEKISLSPDDQKILNEVIEGNYSEIEAGKLVQEKGTSASVKDFGKRLSDDHKILNDQIKTWASKNEIKIPASMTEAQKAELTALSKLSGAAFDKDFLQSDMADHQKDVERMQRYIETAKNSEVKVLIVKVLPILENHLRVAENIAGRLDLSPQAGLNRPIHPTT